MKYNAIIFTDSSPEVKVRALGAYSIANSLRKNGYTALVIDYYSIIDMEVLLGFLYKFVGDTTYFIGYSSSLFPHALGPFNFLGRTLEQVQAINRVIKQINPNTQIIFGGAYSKDLCKANLRFRQNAGMDYAMHGYSEQMIVDFVKNCQTGQPQIISSTYNKLKEINYDSKGDSFKYCDSRHFWDPVDFIEEGDTLPIEISRGCIFRCKFCAFPLLGKRKDDSTYIKLEDTLLNEFLENYEKYKTLNYIIIDDTFNERMDKMEMVARVRDKSKLNLSFTGYNRLDLIHRKPEQLKILKDINFVGHVFGIESLNYESAKIIGKGIRPEDTRETLNKIKETFNGNVSLVGSFIVGLPHETNETFQKWFTEISQSDYPLDRIVMSPLVLSETTHSKSEFLNNPARYGYDASVPQGWKNDVWDYETCKKISDVCINFLDASGRNKMGGMLSLMTATMMNLNFEDLIKIPKSDFNFDKMFKVRDERRQIYIDKLKKL